MHLEMGVNDAHRCCYAVTETLALIIVIMIATSSISFIVFWGVPYMDQEKESVVAESAFTQFQTINNVIQDVSGKGRNGSSMIDFVAEKGNLFISSSGERFIFYYSLVEGFDFNVSGLNTDPCTQFFLTNSHSGFDPLPEFADVFYLNSDESEALSITVIDNSEAFCDTPNPLADAVQIDIKDIDENIIGRIWLFDPGSMYYELAATKGTYQMIAENGGVVSAQNQQRYLAYEPGIQKNGAVLFIPIIQLTSESENILAGDSATRTLLIKSNGTYVRETGASVTTSFKCAIYGEHSGAWENYFISQYTFIKDGGTDILYHRNIKTFILTHSKCEIAIVG